MKRFFAGQSDHGSSTSHGFANDWTVYAFDSKRARDKFVADSDNLTCTAIDANKATRRAANWSLTRNEYNAPKPFTNEYWGVGHCFDYTKEIPGCIGVLVVCGGTGWPEEFKRFYS